ncbi:MAG: DUF4142 domain-containing protein [Pseudomonadota bacterium]
MIPENPAATIPGGGAHAGRHGRPRTSVYPLGALTLLLALGACREREPDPGRDPPVPELAQSARYEGSPVVEPPAQRSAPPGGESADVDAEDAQFLQQAAVVGAFEVGAARLAAEKGTAPSIRNLADAMVREQTQLLIALQALAATKRVPLPSGPDPEHSAKLLNLREQAIGADFDEDYADAMHESHEKAIELFETAAERTDDSDVRDFARSALQLLRDQRKAIGQVSADQVVRSDPPRLVRRPVALAGPPRMPRSHT